MNAEDSLKLARRFIGLPLEKRQLFLQALQKEGVDFSRFPIPAGVEVEDRQALSYAQQRMWFLWQLDPASGAYNLPGAVRLKGALDLGALEQAFASLVARHETLRTVFQRQADERLMQVAIEPSLAVEHLDFSELAASEREQAVSEAASRQSLLPFDLENGPLLRVQLLKLAAREHVLLLTLHHIVSDGWSMNVLIDEFIRCYDAHERNAAPQLPALPIQYGDYALWQRRWLEAGEQARQLDYWQARLGDEHPVLELPTDRPRPAMPSYRGKRHDFAIDPQLAAQLRTCAQKHNVTLFMLLLGAFNVLLHRYTGQADIRVGVPIANRNRTEVEGLIGFFVNTQVLRTELTGQTRVDDLLQGIKEHALGAQAHQELPFERLVEALKVERSLSHTPLFQVMYNHQPVVADIASVSTASGLELALVEWQGRTTQFDLTLDTYEKSGTLHAALTYACDLFDASSIQRMAGHWLSLLQAMVADGEQRIGELPMLAADEQRVLVHAWNQTAEAYPTERGIHQLIEDQVRATPDAPALVFGAITLTYAQLDTRANRLAHALREKGVGPDALVGICVERSIDMVVGLLAILKAGGAYVPLDPEYPRERLAYMIEDSGIQLLLSQRSLLPLLPVDGIQVIALDQPDGWFDSYSTEAPNVSLHALNLAYVIYTSGSTGKPKGAGNSHRALVNRLCWMQQAYGLDASDAVLQKTPFSFDVSVWEFFWPLMTGARLVVAAPGEHREPARLIETIAQQRITTLHFVPSMLQAFIHEPGVQACTHLRRIVCSGEALPLDAQLQVFAKLPQAALFNLYGPTEAAIDVTHWTCIDEGAASVPIGRPIANLGTYVLDAQLNPVPAGVSGELYLGGIGLARSYHRRPALTAERFVPSPFGDGARLYRTGDRVRQRADGVIEYLGRLDHQVKLRGLRIELGEIEARLLQHPSVREAVVLVQGGKQLVAYLVLEDQAPADLKAWLLDSLPEYMVPTHMVHLAKLPVTANGKLDRKAFPLPDATPQQAYAAPQNALQKALATIWSDVLSASQVGLDDNFFELGGDSIISIQVVSRARQAGIRLSPRDLFQYQSIRSLARVATFEQARVIDQGPVTGEAVLTPVQHSFFEQAIPARQHWNQSLLLTPREALEPARLESALAQLLNHHDALRLRFVRHPQGWQQTHSAPVATAQLWQAQAADDAELAARCDNAQRSLDLAQGPLLRAVLVAMADGSQRLLLVVHHLVVDGVSWRILFEDLQQAYRNAALPAKTSAYQHWAQQLQAHAQTLDDQLPYWQAQTATADLPCDNPQGGLQNRLGSQLEIRLNAEQTRELLQDAPAAYRTQVNDLLLTALARVINRWSEQPAALIQLEGHGREDLFDTVDLSRTVGWFTSLFPVRLEADGELSSAIKSVKEQLRAVPHKGIGYGLLRCLGTPEARETLSDLAAPRITFNYLGQFDRQFNESALFVPATQGSGQAQDPEAPLANWLTVEGQVYGGELALQWGFSCEMFEVATIQRLVDDYRQELLALIAHCVDPQHGGLTPADVTLAQLTQSQLDDLALPARDVQDLYPLSPMQQGMLFHSVYQQGEENVYVSQLRADVQGVEVTSFQRAWEQVLARHDMLRTGFVWQDDQGQALQVVHRQVSLPFTAYDWRERQDLTAAIDSLAAEHHRQGFDLARPPLLRVTLVRTDEDRWHLIYTSHHILMDGWSNALVLNEVLQACKGQALPPVGAGFSQHIAWLQRQDPAMGEAFWRQRLAQLDEPTHLARSVAKSAVHSGAEYGEVLCELEAVQTQRLAAFARAHQVTLNTLVQAAWLLLLQRYTGQSSVACGVTVSGRPAQLASVEQQVGLFINTLPLIAVANPAQSVSDWVRGVQALNLEMREHEHTPLFDIQRWAGSAGEALFDTLVVFENFPVAKSLEQACESGLCFSGVSHQERTNYPLTLTVHGGEQLSLHLEYLRADFAADAVQHIGAYLQGLLQQFVNAPEQALGAVPLLLEHEYTRVLQDWNPLDVAQPAAAGVLQRFEQQAQLYPENIALILDQQRMTYTELNVRANRLAHRLIELGVNADTLVGVAVDRSLEMIVGLLAVLKADGAYVPLDPKYPVERLQCMIEDSGLQWLLTQQPLVEHLPISESLTLVCLEARSDWLAAYSGKNPVPRAHPANLAYLMFTSGSTGRPKGVGIDRASLARHVEVFTELFALQAHDRVLQFGTFNFDGFVEQLYPALCCGAAVVVRGGDLWDSDTFYQQLLEHDISVVDLTTAYWLQLVRDFADFGPRDYGRLRQLHIGGEAMPPEGLNAWRAAGLQAVRLLNTYGPTEATVTATALDCAAYVDGRETLPSMMPIGRVLDGRAIYLLDASLNPVPIGVAGELVIGGPLLARGYFNRPDLTADRFIPDPFCSSGSGRLYRTGDLARYRADGMIEYVGRIDHQVKVRGFRIELGEIEARLLAQAGVREALVIAADNQLVGYIVASQSLSETRQTQLRTQLKATLREELPDYMVPAHLLLLDRLPLSPNGKLDRAALPKPQVSQSLATWIAPVTEVQQHVAAIWGQVLGAERVGLNDHFFEMGGHSLLATQMVSRVRHSLGIEVALRTLFEQPVLGDFVSCLAGGSASAPGMVAADRNQPLLLSYAQERQWFLWQLDPHSSAYHVPSALRLKGPLNPSALQRAFDTLVARHDSLRTHFQQEADRTVQVVSPQVRIDLASELTDEAHLTSRVEALIARPFDLRQGPLMRVSLLRLAEAEHVLVLVQHHIVSDGWSMHVMVDELVQLYAAYSQGQSLQLPAMPIQYVDYARWQRDWMEAGEKARQLDYWRELLGGEQPVLELPFDQQRPAVPTHRGARLNIPLPGPLLDGLKVLAQREGVTLFMLLLASYQALLHRYSGQQDIRVGVPIANRNRIETERLIGFFVNTQVLKAEIDGHTTVRQLLLQVKQRALEAQAHQDLPFEQLVEALQPERSLSLSPLFQVAFNHHISRSGEHLQRLAQLDMSPVSWDETAAHFDLTLDIEEFQNQLGASFSYATDLFARATIERMADHWQNLLQAMVADPQQPISQLNLLGEDEQQHILQLWNQTDAGFSAERLVHELVADRARENPAAVAVKFDAQTLTYGELDSQANRLARALIARGVGPEVRVAIAMPRSAECIVAFLAVMKAGGVYVPLDIEYPRDRLLYMMQDSRAQLLLTDTRALQQLPIPEGLDCLAIDRTESWGDYSDTAPEVKLDGDNLAYVIYTSGSTGMPKGVAVSHGPLVAHIIATGERYETSPADCELHFMSFAFDGSHEGWMHPLINGASVLIRDDSLWLPEYTYAQMHRHNVTMAVFPPVYLQQLAEHAERDGNPPKVRVYCFGGDAVAQASYDLAWRALKPTYLFNGYGPTETVVTPLLWKARKGDPCGAVYAPIGTLLGNRSGYVLDAQLNLQPIGVAGELYLGGEGVARGYLERPGLTAERFVPDPFGKPGSRVYRSGDLTRGRADGVVDYLGRVDHQVKIRGFRIELGEIEARLREQISVGETVVVAQEGPSGKQLVAYVVPASAQVNEVEFRDALRNALKTRLPDYMVPAHFMFLAQMPLTPNGKLDRRNLPQPDVSQMLQAYVAPQNVLEHKLAGLWADVLRLPRVGLNDNFFELGGDSIISIQVVSRARQAGIRFTPKDLFQHQTVQSLAAVATMGGQGPVIDQGLVTGQALLLPIHQYFFQENIAERHHWNQSVVLRPGARLDGRTLNVALLALIEHHDALRLRFSPSTAGWQAEYRGVESHDNLLWQTSLETVEALEALGLEAQRSLDLAEGPLMRAVLVELPDASQRLLLVIHHLVVDGVSWRILLEDLQTVYTQLHSGQVVALPAKTSSTQVWAKRLQAHAQSPQLQEELRFWQEQLQGVDADLPCDNPQGRLHNSLAISVNTRLDQSFTRRLLQEAPAAYRTQVNDLLLTALSRVVTRWTGGDALLVKLEGHGREDLFDDVDLTRTVGWFTSMYPLALTPAASLADSIKGIKEQLRAVPDKGIGFGALRYLGDDHVRQVLGGLAQPRITFNYLGQFDGTFEEDAAQAFLTPTGEEAGAEQSEHALLGNWLEINGQVYGGELTLSWSFSREMFSEDTVQGLADAYAQELQALIEHCCLSSYQGVTPSDFPLAALTQVQVDQFEWAAVDDVYPLAPLQQGMLFHTLYEPQAGDYVNQMRVDVEGLDVPRFRDAWQAALDNHDILRTGFILHGSLEHPLQVVHRHAQLPFVETECPEGDAQQQRLDRLADSQRLQGFNLEHPPLIRIALAHTGPQRSHLIYTSHHILMDGWSSSQLLGEVLERYAGHTPQAQISRYRDFIAWLQAQDKTLREAFWKTQLANLEEPTRLFQALPRNKDHEASGLGEYAHELNAAQMARLKAFAQSQKITLNTLVQSAWLLLLQRYTGQDTVAFGATVSGRPADLRGVEQQVGLFINTLPVVATPRPDMPASQWLQQIQQQNVALREHEHTPLFELQRWAGLGGEALFDTILVFENYPVSEVLEQGAPLGTRFGNVNSREQTHYPLSIAVGVGETLSLHYTYDLGEVDAPTVTRLNQHFLHLLMELVAKPQAALAQLTLLSEPEQLALMAQGNGVAGSGPCSLVQHQFEQQVRRTPHATALIFGEQRLTFDALNRRANRLAHGLIAQGVGPDSRVGIALERSFDMLVGLLAIIKAGGAYVPLDADYPQERLAYMLKDSGVKWLLTQSQLNLPLAEGVRCLSLEGDQAWLSAADDTDPLVAVSGQNLMYVIYTSGTTGNPKGVGVTHEALAQRLAWMQQTYGLQADDVLLQKAPVSFDVSVWECFWPLISGSRLVIAAPGEHRDPVRLIELIQTFGVTTLHFIPSLLQLFMNSPNAAHCTSVRRLFSGGEALTADLRDQILRALPGVVLHNRYGPTETTINATWWPCSLEDGARSPIGRPLGSVICRVLDADLNPVPAGVCGELYVGGDGLARGYLGRPGLSAERFIADPFGGAGVRLYRTGDRVRWSDDGALEYLGRLDQQIKIRGFRVELEEICALLLQQAEVAQAEVVLRQGSNGGQLTGYYVAHRSASDEAAQAQALHDALQAQLPDYMVPKHFVRLSQMPLSPSGKLDRKALPEPDSHVLQGEYVAPHSDLEKQLAAIWQDVLDVEQVGLNDNFFELGGHSLLVINVMSRVQLELGVKISVHELFQHAQLKQLADHLQGQGTGISTEKLSFLDSLLDEMEEV